MKFLSLLPQTLSKIIINKLSLNKTSNNNNYIELKDPKIIKKKVKK